MQNHLKAWHEFDDGKTIGQKGSEGGIIVLDEECSDVARITLEQGDATPFSITCGIYGWMAHTRFFPSKQIALQEMTEMKAQLVAVTDSIPDNEQLSEEKQAEVVSRIEDFIQRFP